VQQVIQKSSKRQPILDIRLVDFQGKRTHSVMFAEKIGTVKYVHAKCADITATNMCIHVQFLECEESD
jgi:hypothetical protein